MTRRITLLLAALSATRALAADAPAAPKAALPAPAPTRAAPPAAPRNDSSVAPTAPFDNFRLITERNIFNPNRTGRRERSEEQAPRTDYLSLVGTLESDKGLRAFFDGSDSSLRKALRVGDTIDKFKVAKITPNVVDLERDGKTISMRVGQQFRRPEGADWNTASAETVNREVAPAKADAAAPAAVPADASDLVRQMMERRNKQLKQ
jgi:hypothetical protein